jgi:hypothetical protein
MGKPEEPLASQMDRVAARNPKSRRRLKMHTKP